MATISFARGAPSLDIVDVEGLKKAAQLAFEKDPAGTTAYGTSVGYVPFENLVGRAEIIFFSIDENASAWKVWEWPWTVRWSRMFNPIR